MKTFKQGRLYCFSPPVMIATFVIEVILAAFVLCRYKLNKIGHLIVAMLLALGAFQLAEYYVCTQSNIAMAASRLGYVAITLLPPLGLFLMAELTKPLKKRYGLAVMGATVSTASYFLLAPGAFDAYKCTGNYVIFQIGDWQTVLYSIFYFGLIIATLVKGVRYLQEKPKPRTARAIKWLLTGYALFIVPVAILTVFHPDTSQALPSVLCGFAITMALVLGLRIAPLNLKKRQSF